MQLSFWKIVAAEENSTHFSSTLRHFGYTQFCTARIGSKLGTLITKSTGTDTSFIMDHFHGQYYSTEDQSNKEI